MGKRAWVGVAGASLLWAAVIPVEMRGAEAAKPEADAPARWSDLAPLVIRTPFDNVRYPHLDEHGNVTFIADDAVSRESKGANHGIFRYAADRSLVCLVRAGETTVPGAEETLKTVQGLQMDEHGVDFVFNATDSAGKDGLYHWSRGRLETLARTGDTVLPGETQPITSVAYGSLYGDHVLYSAASPTLGAVLVLHDLGNGRQRVLCHAGMPIPGRAGETFQSIGSTNWVSGDTVIFRAACAVNPGGPNTRGTAGVYGYFGIKDWSDGSQDLAPERLRAIVDGTASVPVAEVPDGATFDSLGSAPVSGNNTAFWALGTGFSGIFTAKTPEGPVRCIVSNHTEFTGPFKGRFTSFGSYPSVVGQSVVFTGEATEDSEASTEDAADDGADDAGANAAPKTYKGVFVYRLDRGELFTLTDNRAPLEG